MQKIAAILLLLALQDSAVDEGRELLLAGKPAEAAALLQAWCEKNRDSAEAFGLLTKAYLELQQHEKAFAAVRMALDAGHDVLKTKDLRTALGRLVRETLEKGDDRTKASVLGGIADALPVLPPELEAPIDRGLIEVYARLKDEKGMEKAEKRFFAAVTGSGPYLGTAMAYIDADIRMDKVIEFLTKGIELYKAEPARKGPDSRDPEREKEAYVWMYGSYLGFAYWRAGKLDNPVAAGDGEPGAAFVSAAEKAGLKEAKGARVAAGDFDGDGWDDLWLGGMIYRNNRGRFEAWSKPGEYDGSAALWGDLDNDGALDLAVFTRPRMRLFRNEGGKLVEKSAQSNLPEFPALPEGNAFLDVNGDGLLDIYCAIHETERSAGQPDHLFVNKGGFVFEDRPMDDRLCGRGAAPADFDNDGQQDLYVCNYRLNPNFLFLCDGKGGLVDHAARRGVKGVKVEGSYGHSIGAAWGDLDNDGDLDLAVGNLAHPRFIVFSNKTMVYENLGAAGEWKFRDRFAESGIEYEETHSDVSMCDYDNDGKLDLYLTSVYRERPCFLYRNQGGLKFKRVTWKAGPLAFDGWGHAWLDYDNDGDMDLIVCTNTWGTFFYENQLNPKQGWVQFRLRGHAGGVGARLTVKAGDLVQIREVAGGRGTTSQDTAVQHVGLGDYAGEVDVEVRWPGGRVQKLEKLASGRRHDLEEPR